MHENRRLHHLEEREGEGKDIKGGKEKEGRKERRR